MKRAQRWRIWRHAVSAATYSYPRPPASWDYASLLRNVTWTANQSGDTCEISVTLGTVSNRLDGLAFEVDSGSDYALVVNAQAVEVIRHKDVSTGRDVICVPVDPPRVSVLVESQKSHNGRGIKASMIDMLLHVFLTMHLFMLWCLSHLGGPRKIDESGADILLTGTFYSDNWVLAHIRPLALSTKCRRIRLVSTYPLTSFDNVEVVVAAVMVNVRRR